MLGANHGLGAGQRGHGLVAVSWQQQPLQVGAQPAALRQPVQQGVELGGVVLQGAGGGWAGKALGHCAHLRAQAAELLLYTPAHSQVNKLPVSDHATLRKRHPGEQRLRQPCDHRSDHVAPAPAINELRMRARKQLRIAELDRYTPLR
jgi:hypothetical protein